MVAVFLDLDHSTGDKTIASPRARVRYRNNEHLGQDISDRPAWRYMGSAFVFYICDDIHLWCMEQIASHYIDQVELQYVPEEFQKVDGKNKLIRPGYWQLAFQDQDIALLFKLTWGGA